MTTMSAHSEPTKCLACGIMLDDVASYCADCVASGQAEYDCADRSGDPAARTMGAHSDDAEWLCELCGDLHPAASLAPVSGDPSGIPVCRLCAARVAAALAAEPPSSDPQ